MKLILLIAFFNLLNADVGVLTKIVDGDTVHFFADGKKVNCRLAYIDTPESKANARAKKYVSKCNLDLYEMIRAGKLSSQYTASNLKINKKYRYEIVGKDEKNNRSVCEIYIDNTLFNVEIVKNGFAIPYFDYIKENTIRNLFQKALDYAKNNHLGLWSTNKNEMHCLIGDENISFEQSKNFIYFINKVLSTFLL
jgi:endonuclease YncB( thermonuclease family)